MIKNFFKQSITYLIFGIISKVVPFIMLPIIIRLISSADYGVYSLFNTIENMLIPVVSLNVYTALSRFYYDGQLDFKKNATASYSVILMMTVILILIASLLPQSIIEFIGLSSTNLIIAIICACLQAMTQIFRPTLD